MKTHNISSKVDIFFFPNGDLGLPPHSRLLWCLYLTNERQLLEEEAKRSK